MNLYSFTKEQLIRVLPRYVVLVKEIQEAAQRTEFEEYTNLLLQDKFDVDKEIYRMMMDVELGIMVEDRLLLMRSIFNLAGDFLTRYLKDKAKEEGWDGVKLAMEVALLRKKVGNFTEDYVLTAFLGRINKEALYIQWGSNPNSTEGGE